MQKNNKLFDRLLAEYILQTISAEDKEKMFSMILQTPSYKEQYEKAMKLNALLRVPTFKSSKDTDYLLFKEKANIHSIIPPWKSTRKFTMFKHIAAAVALILLSSISSIYLYTKHNDSNQEISWVETSTPLGGQTRLLLPDGTVAWVNSKSELKYSSLFGITDRQLYLKGEAYFEVKKNKELPFSIHAGDMTVTATGTQFNVRSYPEDDKWEINLLEGGVDVVLSGKLYSLIPDEKIIYDRTSNLAVIEQVDANLAMQWTKGKLSFYQASIPEIYKMLEKHFNVRIVVESNKLKEEYFMGSINLDMSLSEILSYLDVDKKYKFEVKNDIISVKEK
ncbi:FecR family protein [Parabacteroides pacaensis]|uniref:FecR family protein n=1 Tax=Parabacteroides pacaensis TaxID=2086575 RepID=UPI000D0F1BD9|nr:FecR family protein [Parabacteroides pacaensis]